MTQIVQPIKIKDVAEKAGVSVGTVSRYLNGFENISPQNMEKVRQAVDALGYRHCQVARALASRRSGQAIRTGNIGVYYPHMSAGWASHPLMTAYVTGIERACAENDAHMLLEFSEGYKTDIPRFVRDQKIDGLLIKDTHEPYPSWLLELSDSMPVVGMAMSDPSLNIPQISPDDHAAGYQVAEYLWQKGHRRIAFVSAGSANRMLLRRKQGVEEFLMTHGALDPSLLIVTYDPDLGPRQPELYPPDMRSYMHQIWDRPEPQRPSALIAANDWMALGCYAALESMGIKPGADLSIVGYDNVESLCKSVTPQLTSYCVPVTQAAYAAARMLLDQIQKPDRFVPRGLQLLTGEMFERDSVCTRSMV